MKMETKDFVVIFDENSRNYLLDLKNRTIENFMKVFMNYMNYKVELYGSVTIGEILKELDVDFKKDDIRMYTFGYDDPIVRGDNFEYERTIDDKYVLAFRTKRILWLRNYE